jgi:deoxyribodipyrimidine photo-lyase
MKKTYQKSLFLFHRDLRLVDNTGLNLALTQSESVFPAFIFDSRQIEKNPYGGLVSVGCMVRALNDLDQELMHKKSGLSIGYGVTHEVLKKWIKDNAIDVVFSNRDYTPFAQHRDDQIAQVCAELGVSFIVSEDALLSPVGSVLKSDKKPYTIYTPFFNNASQHHVDTPNTESFVSLSNESLSEITIEQVCKKHHLVPSPDSLFGGRTQGLKVLSSLSQFTQYDKERNIPAHDEGTTHLSIHHKFGTISPRETYHAVVKSLGKTHTLIRELYWRDFFTHIAHYFPHVFGESFKPEYDQLEWEGDGSLFRAWCDGQTGFPIVDAGMRQLNETGYMHNRVRMIVASFLTKDLRVDWRLGERYFAQHLADYDPAVNNGNWQWAASTGCDAQPYFRIFNPWTQQKTYDPDCLYIKKWVPELATVSAKEIHALEKGGLFTISGYPKPIVDHDVERKKTLLWFRDGLKT